jgi:hypothetical protein
MSARKRRHEEEPGGMIPYNHFGTHLPKRDATAAVLEIDICSLPVEGISAAFDPNQALIRRVFFLNEDRKYVSVAFYPTQCYAAHVEFRTAKAAPTRLTEQQFTVLAEHLPRLWCPMCQRTSGNHDAFWMTEGSFRTAWMYLGLGKQQTPRLQALGSAVPDYYHVYRDESTNKIQ